MKTKRLFIVLGFLSLTSACTSLPKAEFAGYRAVFDKARDTGESVLLDFAAMQKANEAYEREKAPKQVHPTRRFEFDISSAVDQEWTSDPIGVRMQAWELVARYNEALTRLAEGKSADEIGPALDSFVESLRSFPVERVATKVAEASESFAPFAGVVKGILSEVEKEWDRRDFVAAVKLGAPLIRSFVQVLEKDAQNFYEIRLGLRNRDHKTVLVQLRTRIQAFVAIASEHGANYELRSRVEAVNSSKAGADEFASSVDQLRELLMQLPEYQEETGLESITPANNAKAWSQAASAELALLSEQIETLVHQSKAIDDNLLAYRDAIKSYVKMLRSLDLCTQSLLNASSSGQKFIPPTQELLRLVTQLRSSFLQYQETR